MIKLQHILNAYNSYKLTRYKYRQFTVGRHIGYLKACLLEYGYLETEVMPDGQVTIKREILISKKWYRSEIKESLEQAVIRSTEKLLKNNNLIKEQTNG